MTKKQKPTDEQLAELAERAAKVNSREELREMLKDIPREWLIEAGIV